MAEAMIPPEMRPKLINDQMEKKANCESSPNLISLDSPERTKRKKNNNNVVIAIPAEIKRHKMTHITEGHEVRRIIEAISTAVSRGDRLSAIGAACASFNHDVESVHNDEIQDHYADSVLCKHIAFLLLKEQQHPAKTQLEAEEMKKWDNDAEFEYRRSQFDESDEEIGYACSALEMVCRASASVLSRSFEKLGPELLDLLIAIIYRKASNQPVRDNDILGESSNPCERFDDLSTQRATKIMCHLARAGSTVEAIAHHPGILRVLKDIIETRHKDNQFKVFDDSNVNDQSYINSLWILGNLACAPGNMSHILNYPGLQECLLNVIIAADATNQERTRSSNFAKRLAAAGQALRIYLNLSWTDENKTKLCYSQGLIEEIMKMISFRHFSSNKKINSLIHSARQHAIGTLRNIAATPSCNAKLRLCQEKSMTVLQSLCDVITSNHDEKNADSNFMENIVIKERAIATVYNLICKDTVDVIVLHEDLYKSLVDTSSDPEKHREGDIKKLLETTFQSIKKSVTSDMRCYELIMGPSIKKEDNDRIESDDLIQFTTI